MLIQQDAQILDALLCRHGLVAVARDDRCLRITGPGGTREDVLQEIAFLTGLQVRFEPVRRRDGNGDDDDGDGDGDAYGAGDDRGDHQGDGTTLWQPSPGVSGSRGRLEDALRSSGAVALIDAVLRHAAGLGASDVHIEPYEERVRVRMRLDGVLHEVGEIPVHQKEAVAARVKIMATLDIAEKRRPQDGRLRFEHDGRPIDVRISTIPAAYGEKVVMRLLDRAGVILDLAEVGLKGRDLALVKEAIEAPHGMIVVTGPTGSGKTTTLYAALSALNREEFNVLTAEDPIEYDLPGINQVRVRPDISFSFAEALRSFLRQDPDVIMVGEVRDQETAEIAIRAALTGHLVLTTLHTNDAATAVTRLVDMGVEPYLVAASLRLSAAQRLVRCVCTDCAREIETAPADIARLGKGTPAMHLSGAGCEACSGTGYRGRAALFELMPVNHDLAEQIASGADAGRIRAMARDARVRSLREAGVEAIANHITTPDEVLRATS